MSATASPAATENRPRHWKHWLTTRCTFIAGAFFFLEYILPSSFKFGDTEFKFTFLSDQHENVANALILIGAMAVGLGIINLLRVHGLTVLRAKKGWINSLALLSGLCISLVIEGGDFLLSERRTALLESVAQLPAFLDIIGKELQAPSTEDAARKRIVALQNYLNGMETLMLENGSLLSLPENLRGEDKGKSEQAWQKLHTSLTQAQTRSSSLLKEANLNQETTSSQAKLLRHDLQSLRSDVYDLSEFHYQSSGWQMASEFMFKAFFTPLGSAMFSLLAFYVATAAYRTFRIRSMEAAIMMLTSVVVMLGQIPHGVLYISSDLPEIRRWLMENINAPAFRAIYFGSAIAMLAMAIRMWLSLEKSPLSEGEEGY